MSHVPAARHGLILQPWRFKSFEMCYTPQGLSLPPSDSLTSSTLSLSYFVRESTGALSETTRIASLFHGFRSSMSMTGGDDGERGKVRESGARGEVVLVDGLR